MHCIRPEAGPSASAGRRSLPRPAPRKGPQETPSSAGDTVLEEGDHSLLGVTSDAQRLGAHHGTTRQARHAQFVGPSPHTPLSLRISGGRRSLLRLAARSNGGRPRHPPGTRCWRIEGHPLPPQAPANAGAHLWPYPQALQAMAGDGYLPAQVSSDQSNPTHSPSCDDGHLPFREPDQVPFWSGGQGQDGAGRSSGPVRI
jgi:hypothetical protein